MDGVLGSSLSFVSDQHQADLLRFGNCYTLIGKTEDSEHVGMGDLQASLDSMWTEQVHDCGKWVGAPPGLTSLLTWAKGSCLAEVILGFSTEVSRRSSTWATSFMCAWARSFFG